MKRVKTHVNRAQLVTSAIATQQTSSLTSVQLATTAQSTPQSHITNLAAQEPLIQNPGEIHLWIVCLVHQAHTAKALETLSQQTPALPVFIVQEGTQMQNLSSVKEDIFAP